jgi:2'-5' RNA ligase
MTGPDEQNLFALVNYTPEPLTRWLLRLRSLLRVTATSDPHITILPPRPLILPVSEAKQKLVATLAAWRSFEIELTGIRLFPGSNVLYLEVDEGSRTLQRLHEELNAGDFSHVERFDFHPHVTVGGPVPAEDLDEILTKAEDAWMRSRGPIRFTLKEIAFVSILGERNSGDWQRLWTYKLDPQSAYSAAAQAAITNRTF